MKTLGTQVRLRRALRVHAELQEQLAGPPVTAEAQAAAAARLRGLVADAARAWTADLATAAAQGRPAPSEIQRHVRRALGALDAAAAAMASPGAAQSRNLDWLGAQFREVAVPLQFVLSGLDSEAPAAVRVLRGAA